jgi:8-oxo-dGTP diphosphatase
VSDSKSPADFSGAKIALLCGDHLVTYLRDQKDGIPYPGHWDLPGGGREGLETPIECALREVAEEFALTISPGRVIWEREYLSGVVFGTPSFFLAAEVSGTEVARIRFGSEGQRWKMMRIDDFLARSDAIAHHQTRLKECLRVRTAPPTRALSATAAIASSIRVSALFRGRLQRDLVEFRPTHVVSLLDPSIATHRIPAFTPSIQVLERRFSDGDDPKSHPLTEATVCDIVSFAADWVDLRANNEEARLLVHCHMGASRSTAVAFVALAIVHGPGRESDAFDAALSILNKPWPNINLVKLADRQLGRDGALLEQLLAYRARYPRRIRAYARLNRLRDGGW